MTTPMLAHKTFSDYDDYVYRQGGKATRKRDFLLAHLPKNTENFHRIFTAAGPHLTPGSVLCLGARTGAESLGAVQAGFAGSVGIDLHPVGPTVLRGDWHDLPFQAGSFANAYTNSLDHCLYLDKLTAEVKRVLAPGGRFYLMATNRTMSTEEWLAKEGNEALHWETSDQLSEAICGYGFAVVASWHTGKWGHYVFRVTA
jgi:SAM-dependent methyltransferase